MLVVRLMYYFFVKILAKKTGLQNFIWGIIVFIYIFD